MKSYLETNPEYKKAHDAYVKIVEANGLVYRIPQANMIADLISTCMKKTFACLESGPGTGKTLTELVAAAFVAHTTGVKVCIATPRKDLQAALIKTFDMVSPYFRKLRIGLLKGKSNYISVAKLQKLELKAEENFKEEFKAFYDAVGTFGGDLDFCRSAYQGLAPLNIPLESLALPLSASNKEDMQYYLEAKERAKDANILIINHTLLALMSRQNFGAEKSKKELPFDLKCLIIDEAHMFVESVRSFLSDSLAFSTVARQADSLADDVSAQRKFTGMGVIAERASQAAVTLKSLSKKLTSIYEQHDILKSFNLSNAMWSHRPLVDSTENILRKMSKEVNDTVSIASKYSRKLSLDAVNSMDVLKDSQAVFSNYLHALRQLKNNGRDSQYEAKDTLFIITFSPVEHYPSMARVKRNVSTWLNNILWQKIDSAALISGTLADATSTFDDDNLQGSFHCVKVDTGLIYLSKTKFFMEAIYPKPFKWDKVDVFIYAKSPLAKTASNGDVEFTREFRKKYLSFSADVIIDALATKRRKGGALVLSASHEDSDLLHKMLVGKTNRILITQGITHKSLQSCLDVYSLDPINSLLVSTAAWQGTDLPGEMLTELFIIRIPWPSPDSPQHQSRITKKQTEKGEKTYGYNLVVTDVFNKIRQGITRLPRGEHDSGKIHILDPRVLSDKKHYQSFMSYLNASFKKLSVVE